MQMPEPIRRAVLRWALRYAKRRGPDVEITGDYLHRWYVTPWSAWYRDVDPLDRSSGRWWQRLIRRLPGVYLHIFGRSDYDRALHDHPWASLSLVLEGGYWEHMDIKDAPRNKPVILCAKDEYGEPHIGCTWRAPGTVTGRWANQRHRIELDPATPRAVTVFATGWRRRYWGFACSEGWRSYPNWLDNGGCD